MTSAVCVENCVEVHNFADYHNLDRLKHDTECHIIENFPAVYEQDTFLDLTEETLQTILSSDDLNISNEEIVCEALLRWLNHDRKERKYSFISLLFCVRFPLIDIDYIKNKLFSEPLFYENIFCRELMEQVSRFGYQEETLKSSSVKQFNSTPRTGMSFMDDRKMIIFSGGDFLTHTDIISPEEIAHLMMFSESFTSGSELKREQIETAIAKEWEFFDSLIKRGITIKEIRDFVLHTNTSMS